MKTEARKFLIAPSILSADFTRLGDEIRDVEKSGCDVLHVDVMDGHFVPNLTIGPPVIRWIRKITKLPLDVHLMIENPERSIGEFRKAGADWITVHVEATRDALGLLQKIKELGARPGISLRPATPFEAIQPYLDAAELVLVMSVEPGFGGQAFIPETLGKVERLAASFKGGISIDGGINPETGREALRAGADILVAGTAIFGQKDRAAAISALRKGGF